MSSCTLAAGSQWLLLLTGLISACEVNSLELQSPGDSNPSRADLLPGPIEAPESIPLDSLLQMHVGVQNSGTLTAGPGWVVRVFLSSDAIIDSFDHQIDQFTTTRELAPGSQDFYLRNKKLSGVGPGVYFIGSIVDATEIVPELTETNNVLLTPGRITLRPEVPAP